MDGVGLLVKVKRMGKPSPFGSVTQLRRALGGSDDMNENPRLQRGRSAARRSSKRGREAAEDGTDRLCLHGHYQRY